MSGPMLVLGQLNLILKFKFICIYTYIYIYIYVYVYIYIYIYIYIYMIGSTINNNVIPLHSVSWVISPIFRWLLQLF